MQGKRGETSSTFVCTCTYILLLSTVQLSQQGSAFFQGRKLGSSSVQLRMHDRHVVLDNGILQVTLSNPEGSITGIRYNNVDNILDKGYWDLDWSKPADHHNQLHDRISTTKFVVIKNDPSKVEISFVRTWNRSNGNNATPLNIDIRFVMMRDQPGFYSYAIYEHLKGWPAFGLAQTRIVMKLSDPKFHYMAISDTRQREMPTSHDLDKGKPLDYKEAVLLTHPRRQLFKGEVDCKYQYSCEDKDCKVHGWISTNSSIGIWTIIPSNEFRCCGPFKQDLTSHAGPVSLAMFHSLHYSGEDVVLKIQESEYWKKVYGPIFFYLNAAVGDAVKNPYTTLWQDAKRQMMAEVQSWPYNFPTSTDYFRSNQRGSVTGRLFVQDTYVNKDNIPANSAYIGLAPLGDSGSWQREGKGYQFWSKADANGSFSINNVREGQYNLFATVPHFIGDHKHTVVITITPGHIDLGDLVYKPPREGPTLWEIGIADRSAAEFYIPDPLPNYTNKLYVNDPSNSHIKPSTGDDKFRQYGLWEMYAELYPSDDLEYIINVHNYSKDWFFAHVTRKTRDNKFQPTTWKISFQVDNVIANRRSYKLRLALASATDADLHVRVNDPKVTRPLFRTGLIGKDNAIARLGIHGLYRLYSIDVPSNLLKKGLNAIYLTQTRSINPFQGIMYDYIRLEEPPA
ncbi:rhamnogalacturonan endolyase [Ranunculus cassubicifolius]